MASKAVVEAWEEQGNRHLDLVAGSYVRPYHRVVAELAARYSGEGDRVLDLGCGLGQVCQLVLDAGARELHVADAYQACLDETAKRVRVAETYLLDEHAFDVLEKLPRDFDVVIMSHVLEHMREPIQAVRDALELVAPGGHLILAVPNPVRPDVILKMAMRKHYVNRGHVIAWDRSHWINFLENILELDVVEYGSDFIPIRGWRRVKVLERLSVGLARLLPWWSFSHIAVVRKGE